MLPTLQFGLWPSLNMTFEMGTGSRGASAFAHTLSGGTRASPLFRGAPHRACYTMVPALHDRTTHFSFPLESNIIRTVSGLLSDLSQSAPQHWGDSSEDSVLYHNNGFSLPEIIENNIDITRFSNRYLRFFLEENGISCRGAIERKELIDLVQKLIRKTKEESLSTISGDCARGNDQLEDFRVCQVCFNSPRNCVIMDCRHFSMCMDCGKKTKAIQGVCPLCREPIRELTRVFLS